VWHGVEAGRGRLRGRQISVLARGRGAAAAPRLAHLWLSRPTGVPADAVPPDAPAAPVDEQATVRPLRKTG
jgi:hypothetical protein